MTLTPDVETLTAQLRTHYLHLQQANAQLHVWQTHFLDELRARQAAHLKRLFTTWSTVR